MFQPNCFSPSKCFAALMQSEGSCKPPALVRLHGFTPPGGQARALQCQDSWLHSNRCLVPGVGSGKYSFLQSSELWGGPGEWSPLLMYRTAGAKPGLSSSRDFAHYSPDLPEAAHFIRQYFRYWSERHSLKSATVKKMCILYIPNPLHVPVGTLMLQYLWVFQDPTHRNS